MESADTESRRELAEDMLRFLSERSAEAPPRHLDHTGSAAAHNSTVGAEEGGEGHGQSGNGAAAVAEEDRDGAGPWVDKNGETEDREEEVVGTENGSVSAPPLVSRAQQQSSRVPEELAMAPDDVQVCGRCETAPCCCG